MAKNIYTWARNAGRSTGYVAKDIIADLNPAIKDFAETNADLGKQLFESIKDYKGTYKRGADKVIKSDVIQFAAAYKKNLFEDLKSGNFYNKEREAADSNKYLGGMDDFSDMDSDFGDMNFDEFESDEDSGIDEGDEFVANQMNEVGAEVSNAVGMATARSAEYIVAGQKESTKILHEQQNKLFGNLNLGLNAINSNMANILGAVGPMKMHMENSTKFYETITDYQKQSVDLLKRIADNTTSSSANTNKEIKERRDYSSVVSSEQMVDLKEYFSTIGDNFQKIVGGVSGMNKMFGEDTNALMTFASSPISGIMKMVATKIIPGAVKTSMETFNQGLQGLFGSMIMKFNNLKDSDNIGLQTIGKLLGIDSRVNRNIDTKNYTKGKVDWDGKARMALIEVIPTYLSKILSALTGKVESRFNYESGKYVSAKEIQQIVDNRKESSRRSATRDVESSFDDRAKYISFKDGQSERKFKEDQERFFTQLYETGKFFDYKKSSAADSAREFGVNHESMIIFKAFMDDMASRGEGSRITRMNGDILDARAREEKQWRQDELSGDNILAALFNNSIDKKDLDDRKKMTEKGIDTEDGSRGLLSKNSIINVLDNKGHNIFFYLQSFYSDLKNIAGNRDISNVPDDSQYTTSGGILLPRAYGSNKKSINTSVPTAVGYRTAVEKSRDDRSRSDQRRTESILREREKELERVNKDQSMGYYYAEDIDRLDKNGDNVSEKNQIRAITDKLGSIKTFDDIKAKDAKKKNIFDKLSSAQNVSEKLKVLSSRVDELVHAPAKLLITAMEKADQTMFRFVYGDGEEKGSFLNAMLEKLGGTFTKFNKWLDESILDPIREKLEVDSFKDIGKKVFSIFGIDIDAEVERSKVFLWGEKNDDLKRKGGILTNFFDDLKGEFHNAWDWIKTGFKDIFGPLFDKIKEGTGYNKWKAKADAKRNAKHDAKEEEKEAANFAGLDPDDIESNYNGSRSVRRTGISAVSEGEMIIPAELNPFYKGKVNKSKQASSEAKSKKLFFDKLKKLGIKNANFFGSYSNGDLNVDGTAETSSVDDKTAGSAVDSATGFLKDSVDEIKSGIKITKERLFGKKPDQDEDALGNAFGDIMTNIGTYLPSGVAGSIMGAGFSLITGMIGVPLLGAAAGAAIALTKKSGAVQDWLFGKEVDGEKDGSGMLSKDTTDFLLKKFPDIAKYGVTGMLTTMIPFIPGSPVVGLILGSTLGYAKQTATVQNFLFGDEGLLGDKEEFIDKLKKSAPKMGAGAAIGLIAGPFGAILPNILLGSALGFASTTDKFKELVFGEEGADGEREGGLLGYVKEKMVDPVRNAINPISKQIEIGVKSLFDKVSDSIQEMFNNALGAPMKKFMEEKVINPFTKVFNSLAKFLLKPAGYAISSPFRVVGKIGDTLRKRQVSKGNATYMSASERLDYRSANGMRTDQFSEFDRQISEMGVEELQTIQEGFRVLKDPDAQLKKDKRSTLKSLGGDVFGAKGISYDSAKGIMTAIKNGDYRRALKRLDASNIPAAEKSKLLQIIQEKGSILSAINKSKSNIQDTKDELFGKLKNRGIHGVNDDNIGNYDSLVSKEINVRRNATPEEQLKALEEKKHADIVDRFDEVIQQVKALNDPDLRAKLAVESQEKMKKLTESRKSIYESQLDDYDDISDATSTPTGRRKKKGNPLKTLKTVTPGALIGALFGLKGVAAGKGALAGTVGGATALGNAGAGFGSLFAAKTTAASGALSHGVGVAASGIAAIPGLLANLPATAVKGMSGLMATPFGGPVLGIALGSALALASKTKVVQDFLYGKDGDTEKGFVNKTKNFLKKRMPGVIKGGILGSVLSGVLPGGPVVGMAIGAGLGFLERSKIVQDVLFGEESLFGDKKEFKKKAFKVLGRAGLGAALGAITMSSPFGLVASTIIGTTGGIATSGLKFSEMLLGKKDEKGKRSGGVLGAIKNNILEPLKSNIEPLAHLAKRPFKWVKDGVSDFFKNRVGRPFKGWFKKLGHSFTGWIKKRIAKLFDENSLFGKAKNAVKNKVKGAFGKVKEVTGGTLRGALSLPGNAIRRMDMKSGNAEYMTAMERIGLRKKSDDFSDFDSKIAGMSKSDLQDYREQLDMLKDPSKTIKSGRKRIYKDAADAIGNSEELDNRKSKGIRELLKAGKYDEASTSINASSISDKEKSKLMDAVKVAKDKHSKLDGYEKDLPGSQQSIRDKLAESGLDPKNDKFLNKYLANLDTEIDSRGDIKEKKKTPVSLAEEANELSQKIEDNNQNRHDEIIESISPVHEFFSKLLKGTDNPFGPRNSGAIPGIDYDGVGVDTKTIDIDDKVLYDTTPTGQVIKYTQNKDGAPEPDLRDAETKATLKSLSEDRETQKGILKSMTVFDKFKSWFGGDKKEDGEKKKGGLWGLISNVGGAITSLFTGNKLGIAITAALGAVLLNKDLRNSVLDLIKKAFNLGDSDSKDGDKKPTTAMEYAVDKGINFGKDVLGLGGTNEDGSPSDGGSYVDENGVYHSQSIYGDVIEGSREYGINILRPKFITTKQAGKDIGTSVKNAAKNRFNRYTNKSLVNSSTKATSKTASTAYDAIRERVQKDMADKAAKEAAEKATKEAAEGLGKAGIEEATEKIVRFISNALDKLPSSIQKLLNKKLKKEISEKVAKEVVEGAAKQAVKSGGKAGAKSLVKMGSWAFGGIGGLIVNGALLIYDFADGMINANEILGIMRPTTGQRAMAGTINAIWGLIGAIPIPGASVVSAILQISSISRIICTILDPSIKEAAEKDKKEAEAWNKKWGTDYTVDEYYENIVKKDATGMTENPNYGKTHVDNGYTQGSALSMNRSVIDNRKLVNTYDNTPSTSKDNNYNNRKPTYKAPAKSSNTSGGAVLTVSETIGNGSGLLRRFRGKGSNDGSFISQVDGKYSTKNFTSRGEAKKDTLGDSGCAPASAAMIVNSMAGDNVMNIEDAAREAISTGHKHEDGVDAGYFKDVLGKRGISTQYIQGDNSRDSIIQNLQKGKPTVLLGQDASNKFKSKSPFGSGAHYVVATGLDKSGNVIINDPESNTPGKSYSKNILNNVDMGISALFGNGFRGRGTIEDATSLIKSGEGGYNAVNPTDVISVGKLQWRGARAKSVLIQTINNMGADRAMQILGQSLYSRIVGRDNLETFRPNADESAKLSELLATPESKKAQDSEAQNDVAKYIKKASSPPYNITDARVLMYYADLENQSPRQALAILKAITANKSGSEVTLDDIHNAAMANSVMAKYKTRRMNAYKTCGGSASTLNMSAFTDTSQANSSTTGSSGSSSVADKLTNLTTGIVNFGKAAFKKLYGAGYEIVAKFLGLDIGGDEEYTNGSSTIGPSYMDNPTASTIGSTGVLGAQIVDKASSLIGKVRYDYGADNIPGGVGDCSSFVKYVYDQFGISLPRVSVQQSQSGTAISDDNIMPGDLVFFNNKTPGQIGHVGIATGDGDYIHNSSGAGNVVRAKLSSNKRYEWARRILPTEAVAVANPNENKGFTYGNKKQVYVSDMSQITRSSMETLLDPTRELNLDIAKQNADIANANKTTRTSPLLIPTIKPSSGGPLTTLVGKGSGLKRKSSDISRSITKGINSSNGSNGEYYGSASIPITKPTIRTSSTGRGTQSVTNNTNIKSEASVPSDKLDIIASKLTDIVKNTSNLSTIVKILELFNKMKTSTPSSSKASNSTKSTSATSNSDDMNELYSLLASLAAE